MMLPKDETYRDNRYKVAVRALPCTLRLHEHCPTGPSILAHINEGKGMGLKTDDVGAAACPGCHDMVDNGKHLTRDERRYYLLRGAYWTMVMLMRRGWMGWTKTLEQLRRESACE